MLFARHHANHLHTLCFLIFTISCRMRIFLPFSFCERWKWRLAILNKLPYSKQLWSNKAAFWIHIGSPFYSNTQRLWIGSLSTARDWLKGWKGLKSRLCFCCNHLCPGMGVTTAWRKGHLFPNSHTKTVQAGGFPDKMLLPVI